MGISYDLIRFDNHQPCHWKELAGLFQISEDVSNGYFFHTTGSIPVRHEVGQLYSEIFREDNLSKLKSIVEENDIDINMKSIHGDTLLSGSILYGSIKCVKWLIDEKMDIRFMYLDKAIITRNNVNKLEIIELLLKNGADVNHSTYLYTACVNGYLDVAKMLVSYGANTSNEVIETIFDETTGMDSLYDPLRDDVKQYLMQLYSRNNKKRPTASSC